jgi:hypothetical protein
MLQLMKLKTIQRSQICCPLLVPLLFAYNKLRVSFAAINTT